jgi:hypothetical protein
MPYSNVWAGVGNLTEAKINSHLMNQVIIRCTSATRPTPDSEGMTIYETDTDLFLTWNGTVWVPIGQTASKSFSVQSLSFPISTAYARWKWESGWVELEAQAFVTGAAAAGNDSSPVVALPEPVRTTLPETDPGLRLMF